MGTSEPEANGPSVSARLQAVTNELHELEQLIRSKDFDSRVLRDFRGAVDRIRSTAWAVQQWIGLQKQGNPYAVLPALAVERVRSTTQLARDLVLDLQAFEVGIETEGLEELSQAVEDLHQFLERLFKRTA
jgi:hypothetical protein